MPNQLTYHYLVAVCIVCLLCLTITAQDVAPEANADKKAKVAQLFELGNSYMTEKKYDQAIDAYRELLRIEPTNAAAYHNLGASLGSTRRNEEALEAYQAAVKLAPSRAVFQASLASGYMNLRRWDESLAAFNEAIRLDPNRAETYNALGFLYDNTRRFEEALATHKKASELAPHQPASFHNLGLVYMKLGRPADAIAPLEKALKMNPTYRSARYHLSNAFSRLRRYNEAVDSFTKLLELDPDNDELIALRAWNYMYLGGAGREAATDAERYLKLYGWRTEQAPFLALIAIIGFRSAGMDDKAAAVIATAQKKADPTVWPYKIVLMFDGQITADELLAIAANTDQKTEAHTYIGMDLLLKKKSAEARSHFEWVKEYGNRTFSEYPLAVAELERGR